MIFFLKIKLKLKLKIIYPLNIRIYPYYLLYFIVGEMFIRLCSRSLSIHTRIIIYTDDRAVAGVLQETDTAVLPLYCCHAMHLPPNLIARLE